MLGILVMTTIGNNKFHSVVSIVIIAIMRLTASNILIYNVHRKFAVEICFGSKILYEIFTHGYIHILLGEGKPQPNKMRSSQ